MNTDNELLESYAKQGSEPAFRELVERHIHLIHSAALREARGNAALAEDITQAVFTELARRADELFRHPTLVGWLYTCVRRMAANVRRADDRRQRREREASTMNELLRPDPSDSLWQQVRPVLDDAMHELKDDDRTAVVLRFFEGQSLKQVGLAMGLTENAARMRVERSLAKLHDLLARRGVKSTASTLVTVLAAGAVTSAPAALASTVATSALTTAAAASTGSTPLVLEKLLNAAKSNTATAAAFIVLAAGVALWQHARSRRVDTAPPAPAQAPTRDPSPPTPVARQAAARQVPTAETADSSKMQLQVVDGETGEPIPDVKLYLFYLRQDGRGNAMREASDANGRFGVQGLMKPFHGLNMFVTADGHVPKVTTFSFGRIMPADYTMKLERGITVAGLVVDPGGQPVPGAKVEFDSGGNDASLQENVQFGPDTTTVTDLDGHWSCNMVPRTLEELSVLVKHHDYAEVKATVRPGAPEADNLVLTLSPGFTVSGFVQDTQGQPVEGAKVRQVRMNSEGESISLTDPAGAFEFRNINAGELLLSVQAPGLAPAVQTLQVTGRLAVAPFQLEAGRMLRGRVTDEDGHPIAKAWAEVTRVAIDKFKWSTTTDAEGRFAWDSAPAEPLRYSFQAEGFERVYALRLEADGSEHPIRLTREQPAQDTVQISGTVTDADTGLPVDAFRVLMSELTPESAFPFHFAAAGKDGRFSLSFPVKSNWPTYQLQVEKDGYAPVFTQEFLRKAGSQSLELKLKRGIGPSGVVRLPDGGSAINADVLLCTPQNGVTLDRPVHVRQGLNTTTYRAQTDAAGRFSLPAAVSPEGVIVVHELGYAEMNLASSGGEVGLPPTQSGRDGMKDLAITLQPWGRIEGTLMLEGQPVANERIIAGNQVYRYSPAGRRFNFVSFYFEANTDSAGKFSFDKVPPGRCNLFRQPMRSRTGFESHETSVVVNAGGVTRVALGGYGRPVVGKALLGGAAGQTDWESVPVLLRTKTANDLPRPKRADFPSTEAYIVAANNFFEAARARRRFGAFCDGNGAFRLPDIPAGSYVLEIKVRDPQADSVGREEHFGSIAREVVVPESGEGQVSEPLDLGTLELVRTDGPEREANRLERH